MDGSYTEKVNYKAPKLDAYGNPVINFKTIEGKSKGFFKMMRKGSESGPKTVVVLEPNPKKQQVHANIRNVARKKVIILKLKKLKEKQKLKQNVKQKLLLKRQSLLRILA